MATFAHNFGAYSIEGSINYFIKNNLLTNQPVWMNSQQGTVPPKTINFDFPEQPLNFPSFSVTHLGSEEMPAKTFQGDRADGANKGTMRFGMCEIDCWVDAGGNASQNQWMMHLRQMRDMVFKLFEQNRAIPVYDFTVPTAPAGTQTIVRVMADRGIREAAAPLDPNPSVRRKRILITYHWVERF